MIDINLTTGQKVQTGFVLAVLVLAGLLISRAGTKPMDSSITAWTRTQNFTVDVTKPWSTTNQYDRKKQAFVNDFGCYDGTLEIWEYKYDSSRAPEIKWAKVNPRRQQYTYYRDPMAPSKAAKKPYDHAMALAAYSVVNGRKLGLLNGAGLTPEQITAEGQAREAMNNAIQVIKESVSNGTFHPELLKVVMDALADFKNVPGNLQEDKPEDKPKEDSARKVLVAATNYLDKIELEKDAAIEQYISKMGEILTDDEKQKVVQAAVAYEASTVKKPSTRATPVPVNSGRGTGPGAGGRAMSNPRGGATPRGNPTPRGNTTPRINGNGAPPPPAPEG